MFHYLYTNDMRVLSLESKAIDFARLFLSDSVPPANEDKSINNSAKTIGFYLNLENKGNSAILAASEDVRTVVLNFIKTFQYPNPRTMANFLDVNNDKIQIAPLREIIKILFLFSQTEKKDFVYMTIEEVLNFIFYNANLAKTKSPNRIEIINEIKEFRASGHLGENIAKNDKRVWTLEDRQIKELINVLEWSKFVGIESGKVFLVIPKSDDEKHKASLLDIITYEEFWEFDETSNINQLRQSYYDYVDSKLDNEKIVNFIHLNSIHNEKLERNIQDLYFGAPGTGKSYEVSKLISKAYPETSEIENPFVFKTTIHSDYSYYNFVGNIMPVSEDGDIKYDFKAGVFTQALTMAFQYPGKDVFIVIDEMSRGDIASIFGDLFQLLDRDENGVSEYSINNDMIMFFLEKKLVVSKKIYLPSNLHIIGTINTSDQNVNVIDTAFKRRFGFIYVDVDPVKGDDEIYKNSYILTYSDGEEFEWNKLYMALNEFITEKLRLSEDKQVGQFFIKFDNYNTDTQKYDAVQNKLLHYLWDDVQNVAMVDTHRIFNEKYSTFSKLYKAFRNKENVFSDEFKNDYKSFNLEV